MRLAASPGHLLCEKELWDSWENLWEPELPHQCRVAELWQWLRDVPAHCTAEGWHLLHQVKIKDTLNCNHFFVHSVVCLKIQLKGDRMVLSKFFLSRFDLLTLELEVISTNCVHDRWILSTNGGGRYLDIFAGWPFLEARRQAGQCAVTEAERWTCCLGRILTYNGCWGRILTCGLLGDLDRGDSWWGHQACHLRPEQGVEVERWHHAGLAGSGSPCKWAVSWDILLQISCADIEKQKEISMAEDRSCGVKNPST